MNRLLNISIITLSILLVLTGLRIWLFNQSTLPPFYLSWLDSIQIGGNTFSQHLLLGLVLTGLIILKSLLNLWRLVKVKKNEIDHQILWQIKQFLEMSEYFFLMALIVSGIAIYYGAFESQVAKVTFKNIHIYSTWGVIALGAVYSVLWILLRRKIKETDKVAAVVSRNSFVWTVVTVVITVVAVWLVITFVERPVILVSKNINRRIALNGKEGIEWIGADSVTVIASNGDNFQNGTTKITIKSFHTRYHIHFLFSWQDWEASYNRSIEKTVNGWRELKSEYSPFGESVYFEDQLAVSFHKSKTGCVESCHLGGKSRPGRHYTSGDTADLWMWQAISTNPAWELDDGWWGEDVSDTLGGRHYDNSAGGGSHSNLNEEWDEPYFLPGTLWFGNWIWMKSERYMPYRPGLDNYKIGSTLPARLVENFIGDRGDIIARAQWRKGFWTLEVTRKLKTGSPFDIDLRNKCWMSVAVFNNAEKKHAYHMIPIKLIIE